MSLWGNSPSWNFLRHFFLNEFVWCRVSFANCPATMLKRLAESYDDTLFELYLSTVSWDCQSGVTLLCFHYSSFFRSISQMDIFKFWVLEQNLRSIDKEPTSRIPSSYSLPFQMSSARPQTRINQGPIPFKLTHFPVVPMIINLWRIVGP